MAPRAALRLTSRGLPGRSAEQHRDDEQDQEQADDERERRHVTRLSRLHRASPWSRLNRSPDRFRLSIARWVEMRVAWAHRKDSDFVRNRQGLGQAAP